MEVEERLYTLAVLVDNEAGVLSQVSRLFSRKGYNIESLAVGPTDNVAVSRITIEILTTEERITLLANQLRKLLPVHSVKLLVPEHSIRRELVLLKVRSKNSSIRSEIIQVATIFRATIIDVSVGSITLAMIGDEGKQDGLLKMLTPHGILELVRTGIVALERGAYTLDEDTKEKSEFNLGKNVMLA